MRDFRKLKTESKEATERLIEVNDHIQELPDQLSTPEESEERDTVFDQLRSVIKGVIEFDAVYKDIHDAFKIFIKKNKRRRRKHK